MSMPRILPLLLVLLFQLSGSASAAPLPPRQTPADLAGVTAGACDSGGPLQRAACRAAIGRALATHVTLAHAQAEEHRSWPSRHPVLFGALVGGVAGSLVLGLTDAQSDNPEGGEGYLFGFGLGAGAGALVGALVR